ncbi:MAG: thiol-disulfide oxidoreductase DCC family protein [Bacteroidota bacterium]|nr:thiol-disulfide oxidoreductase DCC family protein [Bacteroidota bacterium]
MKEGPVVLFDGVCNLCNHSIQFIIKRDRKKKFLFASLQGKTGQEILKKFGLPDNQFNSFILADGDKVYTRSSAALHIARELKGGWKLLYGFMIVPRFIRDSVYNLVAKNRYKWFGKKEECWVPAAELKERFLE